MPELPEVETIARGLGPVLRSRRIVSVEIRERRLRRRIATDLVDGLVGRRVATLGRHGKYLLVGLDDGHTLIVHLGMSGSLTIVPATAARKPHDHVEILFDGGTRVVYHDPRRFGLMLLVDHQRIGGVTGSGVDALAEGFTGAEVFRLTRRRRASIKALLMDQRLVAGLGNIYVNELLFAAGVRPNRPGGRLTRAECDRLVSATQAVLAAALASGGSSISDYRDGFGRAGSFQAAHRVYDRAGQPCRRCGSTIRGRVLAGRSTFHCPRCQR